MSTQYAADQPAGYNNYITNVAIVGAGGQVGKHITAALLATGKHTVTAVTRAGSDSKLPEGVLVARVPSYSDEAAVAEALRASGAQALVITLGMAADQGTHTHLINAAAAADVPYVLPNWWGGKTEGEALLKDIIIGQAVHAFRKDVAAAGGKSRLIFVACGFWYEFSLAGGPDRFGFDFHDRTFRLIDDGRTKNHVSTWPQTGRAAAAILSLPILPESAGSDALTLSGLTASGDGTVHVSSFYVSQLDMLESVKRVTGTTDADWTMSKTTSVELFEDGRDKFFEGDRKAFVRMLYGRGFFPDAFAFEKLANAELGLPTEDLDEWTKEAVRMAGNREVLY